MKLHQITPEFVDTIPRELEHGKLYISCRYRAVKHLCPCGCGIAVNIPLHPTGWTLICDGVSVSLWPSIGNWNERCQSHYWIRNSMVQWAPKWPRRRIMKERESRQLELDRFFGSSVSPRIHGSSSNEASTPTSPNGWFRRMCNRFLRRR